MRIKVEKQIIRLAALLLGVVLLTAATFSMVRLWEDRRETPDPVREIQPNASSESGGTVFYQDAWYAPRDVETYLVMGLDKFDTGDMPESYINTQQADFLLLLITDPSDQSYCAVHLNRDTMTQIPILGVTGELAGSFTGQLALAHTYGSGGEDSCENTVKAVSDLLYGTEIDHYLSMTMDAVSILNDMAGGVTLTLLDDFSDLDPEMVKGREVTLRGEQALLYVRTRFGREDSTNLHRMERQRQYLETLLTQVQSRAQEDPGFFAESVLSVSDYLVSDCTIQQLSDLGEILEEYTFSGLYTTEGEAVRGEEFMEFYVDDDALRALVMELFYQKAEPAQNGGE